ncbi:monooxygenase FAD-binding protein [Novosphingobium sp. Rr 2-17]|uniref:FAD-dependent oxidoreductase n=1 Tax=Novosphingobium sp. Rr 2-17 TaxID=555793 RepID=UPI00026984D0|nr:FAD-dependent monooxygenase [Novosphingobium sp. Rr 2-17]EIZ80519.1 monooxygenase FAD-binding protein [Novosphingobium sp. Rr 2-17]
MSVKDRCQVAIAGAGPVGTVIATLLAQAGISVILLEAGTDCAQDLRASTFHPPTLEMLDQIGITSMLLEKGLKAPVYQWRDRASGEVIEFDLGELEDVTRYPFRIQCEQYHLSRALASGLDDLTNADVRFGSRLLSFTQDADGVDLAVETMVGIEHIRADFLIGADGANSIVRKWLGIEFDGFTYPERFLTLSTETDLAAYLPNLSLVNYVSDPNEWLVLLKVPSVWRVLVPVDGAVDDAQLVSDANKTAIFDRLVGDGASVVTHHRTLYKVHQRVAQSFREGRVMLVGDAAHLNNPLGGFGMNSGVHDAFNLFEKLLPVLKGQAAVEPALSLYDRQRRQITHSFTQAQTKQNMAYMRNTDGSAHELRRRDFLAIQQDDQRRRAYLMRQAMFQSLEDAAAIA